MVVPPGFAHGSAGHAVVPLANGPVVPLGSRIWTNWDELGAEIRPVNRQIRVENLEFGHENLQSCRSTPRTTDLWIKTTKNATNPEIKFRAIFWDIFQKIFGEFVGWGGENDVEIRDKPKASDTI